MNCEEARQHWHVFHDSEGDAQLHLRINDHLALCDPCAKWFYQQSRLEEGIVAKLNDTQRTPHLWHDITEHCAATQPRTKRRFVTASLLAAALLGCMIFVLGRSIFSEPSSNLAQLSAGLHEELATGREPIKLVSNSAHDVEQYLRGAVTFPVRCPPTEDIGFSLRGGGVCKFQDDQVAYIVGHVDGVPVSVMVMDRGSLKHFPTHRRLLNQNPVYQCRERGLDVVMRQVNDNLVLVTGTLSPGRLRQVLNSYGSHSGDHAHRQNRNS